MPVTHDAFISYSHASDRELGPAVERALEQLARPLFKRRVCDVFLDRSSLAADPSLWGAIERHLEGSRWLLLVASPQSAASIWCRREVEWWLEHGRAARLLILWSAGEIVWDRSRSDFDWSRTDALVPEIAGHSRDEPHIVDLRPIRRKPPPTLRDDAFRKAIVSIAATVRGVEPKDIDGEDLRVVSRNRRLAAIGLAAVFAACAIAAWQTLRATDDESERVAGELERASHEASEARPDQAVLMALESQRLARGGVGTVALVRVLKAAPRLVRYAPPADDGSAGVPTAAAVDGTAGLLALARCRTPASTPPAPPCAARLEWEPLRDRGVTLPAARDLPAEWGAVRDLAFVGAGRELMVRAEGGLFRVPLADRGAPPQLVVRGRPLAAGAATSDLSLVAGGFVDGEAKVWASGKGIHRCIGVVQRHVAADGIVFSPDANRLAVADGNGGIVVLDLVTCDKTPLRTMDSFGAMAFTSDSRWLVAVMLDGTRFRWPTDKSGPIAVSGGSGPLNLSPSGRERSPHALARDASRVALADGRDVLVESLAAPTPDGSSQGERERASPSQLDCLAERGPMRLRGHPEQLAVTRFSTDADWLVSRDVAGTVILWSLSRPRQLWAETEAGTQEPQGASDEKRAVRADGRIAVRIEDGPSRDCHGDSPMGTWTLVLEALDKRGQPISGQALVLDQDLAIADAPRRVKFAVDGTLSVEHESGRLRRWPLDDRSLIALACAVVNREPSPAERAAWPQAKSLLLRLFVRRQPLCASTAPSSRPRRSSEAQ